MKEREERRRILCDALTTRALTYDELVEVGMWGYHLLLPMRVLSDTCMAGEAYNPTEKLLEFNSKLTIQQLLQAINSEAQR